MKEVIFHFFPSVRFLGLSLKILFHKNKEIKRMLSKKMAFSLMSLITILAIAFVAPSAMAQVKVTLSGMTSVSHGGTTESPTDTMVDIVIVTDKNTAMPLLAGTDATVTAVVFDKDSSVVDQAGNPVTFDQSTGRTSTGIRKHITMTVPPQLNGTNPQPPTGGPNLPLRVVVTIPAFAPSDPSDATVASAVMYRTITITRILTADATNRPKVVSIQRLRPGSQTVASAFLEEKIPSEPFNVRIVLSEKPKGIPDVTKTADELAKQLVDIGGDEGVVSNLVIGTPFEILRTSATDAATTYRPHPSEGMYVHGLTAQGVPPGVPGSGNVPETTGIDDMYYEYRVTVTPRKRNADFTLKIKVKEFDPENAQGRVFPNEKYRRFDLDAKPNGREQLTLTVMEARATVKAGYRVTVPKDIVIPANGYLVIVKNAADSEVIVPPGDRTKPMAHYSNRARKPAEKLYNVHEAGTLPNLASSFLGGVVVDVEVALTLKTSEVMWGENVSLVARTNSQYIELYNPGDGDVKTPADDVKTFDKDERLTLVFYGSNEFGHIPAKVAVAATGATPATMALPAGVADRIGTLDATGAYWNPSAKGQSGSSGVPLQDAAELEVTIARTPITPIVSMYRVMMPDTSPAAAAGAMMVEDGQEEASWMSSEGPKNANFDPTAIGIRHGTPGAATDVTDTPADTEAEAEKKAADEKAAADKIAGTGTMPEDGQIYISEVMFAGGGILPQWIEIANGSRSEEVNLSGWTITVDNAAADADVSIGASAKFTIPDGTTVDMSGQTDATKTPSTILVVTEKGRNNIDVSGQVVNLAKDNEIDLLNAGVTDMRRYTLLSDMAFLITLAPPEPEATKAPAGETADAKTKRTAAEKKAKAVRKAATDVVGNLGADGAAAWALPMSEAGRSSIIRRHVLIPVGSPAEPEDGMMMDNWMLASDTDEASLRAESFYGAMNDAGTPGFHGGGALPVELSHFRPARDKATGAVVITWSTQSELNNAGFFIKRSQQRDGEFKVINATMIQGAGTTSEKQFYTYNDSTAQPNVVYYYQIEDVSLDGNHQTLTRGIRLKGHVSVAGKLTTLWGDLKTSQ